MVWWGKKWFRGLRNCLVAQEMVWRIKKLFGGARNGLED
jgi:hypothetical protein